jgi:hypothetical protein
MEPGQWEPQKELPLADTMTDALIRQLNRRNIPQGRGLGGGSLLNGML